MEEKSPQNEIEINDNEKLEGEQNYPPPVNTEGGENKIKNEEDIVNEESKNIINNNIINNNIINNNIQNNNIINNNIINNNIQNNNIINNNIINNNIQNNNIINNNLLFDFPNIEKKEKVLNLDNLSSEEKNEIIENYLHSLLKEVSSIKEEGNEFFKKGNYKEAEMKYKEGIKKIEESSGVITEIEDFNIKMNDFLMNLNIKTVQLYSNLCATFIKQEKYEETIQNCEYIIKNLSKNDVKSYCRLFHALIELKKVIMANHYAEIIKKKFGNEECFSEFQVQFIKLEELNKEFSNKILEQNPAINNEINLINDNLIKEKEEIKEEENPITKYAPYILGGALLFLFAGGRYLYKKFKDK